MAQLLSFGCHIHRNPEGSDSALSLVLCSALLPTAPKNHLECFVKDVLAHAFALAVEAQLVVSFGNLTSVGFSFSKSLSSLYTVLKTQPVLPVHQERWCSYVSLSIDTEAFSPIRTIPVNKCSVQA